MKGAAIVCLLTLLLQGCARAPAPELYLLDVPYDALPAGSGNGPVVGLGPLEFPKYLDRPHIVTRDATNRVNASDAHLWAEPVQVGAARVLSTVVARALGGNRVYLLPRRGPTELDWRVDIAVDRLDGDSRGHVVLAARWELYRGERQRAVATRVSHFEQATVAGDYGALVTAQADLLTQLATEIAAAITVASHQPLEE